MRVCINSLVSVLAVLACLPVSPLRAQQRPQWTPGQVGLNAGTPPSPGFTYVNMDLNYAAGTFNDAHGTAVPVTGTYTVWAIQNMFYFVPDKKVLSGNLQFMVTYPTVASGSLVADISDVQNPDLRASAGAGGIADLWIQPLGIGWQLKRADVQVMEAFMIPTGRYIPGATDNVGTGYFGNHLQTGTTYYITKDKGTSANLFTDWEVHGSRRGTNNTAKTPGQAFTDEWGIGQVLPLKKDMSQLLQLGVIGYDQWQVSADGGTFPARSLVLPASIIPAYSAHAAGGQINYMLPARNLSFFIKFEREYSSHAHTLGNTTVFGGTLTWGVPKHHPSRS